jgi:hypothetical protein
MPTFRGVAALAAGLMMSATAAGAQARFPSRTGRLPATSVTLAPRASVRLSQPVYVMSSVPVTVELSNLRNVKTHLILEAETTACWLAPSSMVEQEITPSNGRAAFSVPLFFVYPEAHGQDCAVHVKFATPDDTRFRNIAAGTVHVEAGQTYTIENTWAVVPFVSSITATRINAPDAPCTGLSLGLAGAVPIGAVEHEHDLSFTIRSGIHPPECTFDSSQPYKRLAQGWAIIGRSWRVETARGASDACSINNYQTGQPAGTWFYVHSQMRCGGGPDNDNGVRLILQRLTLLGPPGRAPIEAFTSGTNP